MNASDFPLPSLSVEVAKPFYVTTGTVDPLALGELGDVNGDGRNDFAVSDSVSR